MWGTDETAHIVRGVLAGPLFLMGASHIVQPQMWREFFVHLAGLGNPGVLFRTFALELVPMVVIVAFHQDWSGPGVVITLYGWALFAKITVSLLAPSVALRSLAMADRGGSKGFLVAGVGLMLLGLLSGGLFWRGSA